MGSTNNPNETIDSVKVVVTGTVRCPVSRRALVKLNDGEIVFLGGTFVGNRKTGRFSVICGRCKGNRNQRTHVIPTNLMKLT